ncbi:hypothetical protein [Paraburkholderia tropica]|uniref:hypothetical protein n=1 Tax=Paraburkholderia tropica TaxID=92647 RepID=UPI002AB76216|nr:hypothetical protein [Paraburkholderia tropica]
MVVPLNVLHHEDDGLAIARPAITSLRVRCCVDGGVALQMLSGSLDAVLFAQASDIEHLIAVLQRARDAADRSSQENAQGALRGKGPDGIWSLSRVGKLTTEARVSARGDDITLRADLERIVRDQIVRECSPGGLLWRYRRGR